MPMQDFVYHGQAVGMHGRITHPASHVIDGHAQCALPDGKPGGPYSGQHDPFTIAGVLSYDRCYTTVHAKPEDNGFFRTEVRATVENLRTLEAVSLSAGRISMGLVSVYRRGWYDRPGPHARRARVLPFDCIFENLVMDGKPATLDLPPPFHYSAQQREAYLTADEPDAAMDAEVRAAIAASPSRFVYIPKFGRIFYGEWNILPGDAWHPVHQISMLRLAMGSPAVGDVTLTATEGDGRPTPP